jgi:hypothetical protein
MVASRAVLTVYLEVGALAFLVLLIALNLNDNHASKPP